MCNWYGSKQSRKNFDPRRLSSVRVKTLSQVCSLGVPKIPRTCAVPFVFILSHILSHQLCWNKLSAAIQSGSFPYLQSTKVENSLWENFCESKSHPSFPLMAFDRCFRTVWKDRRAHSLSGSPLFPPSDYRGTSDRQFSGCPQDVVGLFSYSNRRRIVWSPKLWYLFSCLKISNCFFSFIWENITHWRPYLMFNEICLGAKFSERESLQKILHWNLHWTWE